MKKGYLLLSLLFTCLSIVPAQSQANVYMIGNEILIANNMPQIMSDIATSTGDDLTITFTASGGATLTSHSVDSDVFSALVGGGLNYVIMQEHPQVIAGPEEQFMDEVIPAAETLNTLVLQFSPCAEVIYYRSWGYENGDTDNCASWPPVCSYSGMDDLMATRYSTLAATYGSGIAPVGEVWREILNNNPAIDLFQNNGSSPQDAGSYAAALTLHTIFFKKDPNLVTENFNLSAQDADYIKDVVKNIVFDDFAAWSIGLNDPSADFSFTPIENLSVDFEDNSDGSMLEYSWDFGDENTSTSMNPMHTYATSGDYMVTLTVTDDCNRSNSITTEVSVSETTGTHEIDGLSISISPNPATDYLNIERAVLTEKAHIILFDVNGRQVLNKNLSTYSNSISIETLTPGLYTGYLQDENTKPQSFKIIKK